MSAKDNQIKFKITTTEKKKIARSAKKEGFDSMSAFILFVLREWNKR